MQLNVNIYNNNSNTENNNTFNLIFMKHNINRLGSDHFKFNLLMEYCINKGNDIIGICEINRDRKHKEF